jgi:hypothetical protein
MKSVWMAFVTALTLFCCGQHTFGQGLDKKSFETKMYSIEAISHFGLDDHRFAVLSESEKHNLLESRDDLFAMLRAIQMKQDARPYVTSGMVRKYGSSAALAASLVEAETSILAVGISDFALVDGGTAKLHFFVAAFSKET